jgi:hypothetical protein
MWLEVANAGARLVLAPDRKPIRWSEGRPGPEDDRERSICTARRLLGQDPFANEVAGRDELSEKGIAS